MNRSILNFAKHYAEMVLVMFAGMGVFFGVAVAVAAAVGSSYGELRDDAPALVLFGMGLGMTAAMVWWMARRGHSRAANRAMALSMILPTVLVLALLASGAMTNLDDLVTLEHVVMFPAMLVAMLLYRTEFTHGHRNAHATA
ncbi:MAG TPA: hypothetical protein VHF58_01745 [Solirubrobacterales bacterium]|nr:hypothetical protein [Solirubrobacterales bacterium]